jgi:hypothetical protein
MLDHGILNVPLSKRGNIDSQIDRYKREKAIEKRNELDARKAEFDAKKAKALALIAELSDQRAKELMTKHKMTRKQLDAELKFIARRTPRQCCGAESNPPRLRAEAHKEMRDGENTEHCAVCL